MAARRSGLSRLKGCHKALITLEKASTSYDYLGNRAIQQEKVILGVKFQDSQESTT
jgi:hypothetical protein